MSDETNDNAVSTDSQVAPTGSPESQPQPVQPAPVEANKLDELPPFWQTEVRNLRREGQNKGSRITELTQELENARAAATQRETDLKAEIARDRMEHAKFVAVVEAGIPLDRALDIASRLRGETEDELKADAASFGELFRNQSESRRGVDPSQGAGNGSGTAATSVAHQLSSQIAALRGH